MRRDRSPLCALASSRNSRADNFKRPETIGESFPPVFEHTLPDARKGSGRAKGCGYCEAVITAIVEQRLDKREVRLPLDCSLESGPDAPPLVSLSADRLILNYVDGLPF